MNINSPKLADTPDPPYYAVIFTSLLHEDNTSYNTMAEKMAKLSSQQDGFLGMDSARTEKGITVCYWRDLESIRLWKENEEHMQAKEKGRQEWYKAYSIRIAKVEMAYKVDNITAVE